MQMEMYISVNLGNGIQNGKGKFSFSNGDEYEGTFKNGLFDGEGQANFSNGEKYVGQYKMIFPMVKACKFFQMEINLLVNLVMALKKVLLMLVYQNGDKYEGEFKNNMFNGNGEMTRKDGKNRKRII